MKIASIKRPRAPVPIEEYAGSGLFAPYWFLFMDSLAVAINRLIYAQNRQSTQANLAALAATLEASDSGLLVEVTDYAHVLRWTGTGWEWGPGETGGGYFAARAVAPGPGWHACDGAAAVKYLKSDGTTGTVDLPNTAGTPAYVRAGAVYDKTITAAVVPTTGAPSTVSPVGTGANGSAASNHAHAISLPGDPIANFTAVWWFRQ